MRGVERRRPPRGLIQIADTLVARRMGFLVRPGPILCRHGHRIFHRGDLRIGTVRCQHRAFAGLPRCKELVYLLAMQSDAGPLYFAADVTDAEVAGWDERGLTPSQVLDWLGATMVTRRA